MYHLYMNVGLATEGTFQEGSSGGRGLDKVPWEQDV